MLTFWLLATLSTSCVGTTALVESCGFTSDDVYLSAEETIYDNYGDPIIEGVAQNPCTFVVNDRCASTSRHGRPEPSTPLPITLADIAHFRPSPPVDIMEPNGWMIVGLDANFYSPSSAQVVDGTLLGNPASVRFTPVSWRWTYGDGSTSILSTGGQSWRGLGVQEFDPTPTSHIYRAPGTYTIGLSVGYSAEYRVGASGWTRIPGILTVPAPPLEATAGDAKTVLVARDCLTNPAGPGC